MEDVRDLGIWWMIWLSGRTGYSDRIYTSLSGAEAEGDGS
jgi:hypothetical protein